MKNVQPDKLSVIIPAYNCQHTIEETITSVFSQQCQLTLEMIIVNDGSTDNTLEVIREMQRRYKDISVLNQHLPSGRPSKPRNLGLEKAQGKLVALMDADDVMPAGYLAAAIELLDQGADLVGSLKFPFSGAKPPDKASPGSIYSLRIPRYIELAKNVFSASGLVVRADVIGDVRFQHDVLEDWHFLIDLYKKDLQGRLLLCPRIGYRQSETSITPNNKVIQIRRVFRLQLNGQGYFKGTIYFMGYLVLGLMKYFLERPWVFNIMFSKNT